MEFVVCMVHFHNCILVNDSLSIEYYQKIPASSIIQECLTLIQTKKANLQRTASTATSAWETRRTTKRQDRARSWFRVQTVADQVCFERHDDKSRCYWRPCLLLQDIPVVFSSPPTWSSLSRSTRGSASSASRADCAALRKTTSGMGMSFVGSGFRCAISFSGPALVLRRLRPRFPHVLLEATPVQASRR